MIVSKNMLVISMIFFIIFSFAFRLNAFELRGFSDITLSQMDKDADGGNRSFAIGQVDFYTTYKIDEHVSFLLEFGVGAHDNEWMLHLERIQVGYLVNDYLTVYAGRFHSMLGYWNFNYHHGTYFHTTITRPIFLEFDDHGGFMPTHLVGLWLRGNLDGDIGTLTYDIMVGNGHKLIDRKHMEGDNKKSLAINNMNDDNNNKEVTLSLQYEPFEVIGSGIGIFGTASTINESETSGDSLEVDQLIVGGDIFIYYENLELLSEFFSFKHKDESAVGEKTTGGNAWYIQAGMKFDDFTPYARYEIFVRDGADPYFNALDAQEYKKRILGVRYNLSLKSSIKTEVDFLELEDENTDRGFNVQWGFMF